MLKPFLTETLRLTAALILSLVLCYFLFNWNFKNDTLDLHLYFTHYAFFIPTMAVPIALLIAFVMYFVIGISQQFHQKRINRILLTTGLLLIILSGIAQKAFLLKGIGLKGGWAAYPPLTGMPDLQSGEIGVEPIVRSIVKAITALQITVTVLLLGISFMWFRRTRRNS